MSPNSCMAALVLLVAILLVLPLVPSLLEFRRKSDVMPLNVVQQHAGEVAYFAQGFRTYITPLQPEMERCRVSGSTASGVMPDGAEYLVFGHGADALGLPLDGPDGSCSRLLASSTTLSLPPNMVFSRDIYAKQGFIGGVHNQYRAVLSEKEAHLGSGTRVLRWIHAEEEFSADVACQLFGRISSERSIRLSGKSRFIRLNAPRIEIGLPVQSTNCGSRPERSAHLASQRTVHHGDLVIPAGETIHSDLVVRGRLHIGRGACINGSIKSEKDMFLDAAVVVTGSLITERKMRIGPSCLLHGPIIAERALFIAGGACCGGPGNLTTVSARRVTVEEGVVVFGTLWAREQGRVVGRT